MNGQEFHFSILLFLRVMFGVCAYFQAGPEAPVTRADHDMSFTSPFAREKAGRSFSSKVKVVPIPHLHPLPLGKGEVPH